MTTVYTTPARTGANYIVKVREARAIGMRDLHSHTVYIGEIVRIDSGAVAYTTKPYEDLKTASLQAARYVKNYEHHLRKHGIGFEVQEAERIAKREADRRVRDEAHAVLEALRGLVSNPHPDPASKGDDWQARMDRYLSSFDAACDILARIEGA